MPTHVGGGVVAARDVVAHREEASAVEHRLAAPRQQVVQPQAGGLGVGRLLVDEGDAAQDQGVVAGQDDADVGVARRAVERVGAEHVVAERGAAAGDVVEHVGGRRLEDDAGAAEDADQVPEGDGVGLEVLGVEQVAEPGTARIVGRQAVAAVFALLEKTGQLGMRLGHLGGGDQLPVVGDDDGFEGGAEGFALPHRPGRQRRRLGRFVRQRVAVVDQLELEVHGRAPEHVGLAFAAQLVEEAGVELAGIEVVVLDLDARMAGFEVVDQRLDDLSVGRRVQYHRAARRGGAGRPDGEAGNEQEQARCGQRGTAKAGLQAASEACKALEASARFERADQKTEHASSCWAAARGAAGGIGV